MTHCARDSDSEPPSVCDGSICTASADFDTNPYLAAVKAQGCYCCVGLPSPERAQGSSSSLSHMKRMPTARPALRTVLDYPPPCTPGPALLRRGPMSPTQRNTVVQKVLFNGVKGDIQCVCEREGESMRENVCVCVREREGARARAKTRERQRETESERE